MEVSFTLDWEWLWIGVGVLGLPIYLTLGAVTVGLIDRYAQHFFTDNVSRFMAATLWPVSLGIFLVIGGLVVTMNPVIRNMAKVANKVSGKDWW